MVFASLGSEVFITDDRVELIRIESLGSGLQTVAYGVDATGSVGSGDIIAQAGQQFTGYRGTVTIPEPASLVLALALLAIGCVTRHRK